MKQKTITTSSCSFMLVEVPENSERFNVSDYGSFYVYYRLSFYVNGKWESINNFMNTARINGKQIPKPIIIGKLSDCLTDESLAEMLVEFVKLRNGTGEHRFKGYERGNQLFWKATDSLKSLLKANDVNIFPVMSPNEGEINDEYQFQLQNYFAPNQTLILKITQL